MAIPIAVPPVHEQDSIIEEMSRETVFLRSTAEIVQREIDILCEYRTRLISDVVTGKLDVRAVELPELDDDDEPEYLDVEEEAELDDLDESLEDLNDDE